MNTKKLKKMCFEEFMYFIEKRPFLKKDISMQFYIYINQDEFDFIKNLLINKIKSTQERCPHSYFKKYSKFSFNPLKRFRRKLKECQDCGKTF